MIRYQRNNILFRVASAAAISNFKNLQANSLAQLARRELEFDSSAREAVLLCYERFSQWIYRIERICLSTAYANGDIDTLTEILIESFIDEQSVTESIIESHIDVFGVNMRSYISCIHAYSAKMIENYFRQMDRSTFHNLFTNCVDITSEYLQHILVAMHEFNNNCVTKNEPSFISLADFCMDVMAVELRYTACVDRMNYFKANYDQTEFAFKFYGTNEADRETAFINLRALVRPMGISLVKENLEIKQEA